MYPFSELELFDASDRRPSDDGSSRRYVGAGGGAGLQREKAIGLPIPIRYIYVTGSYNLPILL